MFKNNRRILTKILIFLIFISFFLVLFLYANKDIFFYKEPTSVKVSYLIIDDDVSPENTDISKANHECDDCVLYATNSTVKINKKGKYYTFNLKNKQNHILTEKITDYIVAKNNFNGEVIKDFKYNEKTMILEVPNKYYKNTKDKTPIQIQFLSRVNKSDFENINIKVSVNNKIKNNKKNDKIVSEEFPEKIKFNIGKNISKSEINLYLNDSKTKSNNSYFKYDKKTGNLEFEYPPILLENINVEIEKKSIFYKLLHVLDVSASWATNKKIRLNSPPDKGLKTGAKFYIPNITFKYGGNCASSSTWKIPDFVKNSQYINNYESGKVYLYHNEDTLATNSRCTPYLVTIEKADLKNATDSRGTVTDLTDYMDIGSTSKIELPLFCTHTGEQASGDHIFGLNIEFTKVDYTNRYMVISFKSDQSYGTQTAYGYYVFDWEEQPITLTKKYKYRNEDGTISNKKLENFKFYLYKDSSCSGTAKAMYTDDSGVVEFFSSKYVAYKEAPFNKQDRLDSKFTSTNLEIKGECKPISSNATVTDNTYGKFTAKKAYGEAQYAMKNIEFSLYAGSSCSGSPIETLKTSGPSGKATFDTQIIGKYSYKETSITDAQYWDGSNWNNAPSTLKRDKKCNKLTLNGSKTVTKYNGTVASGLCFGFLKLETGTGAAYSGATFQLLSGTDTMQTPLSYYCETDDSGWCVFESLPSENDILKTAGHHLYVKEISPNQPGTIYKVPDGSLATNNDTPKLDLNWYGFIKREEGATECSDASIAEIKTLGYGIAGRTGAFSSRNVTTGQVTYSSAPVGSLINMTDEPPQYQSSKPFPETPNNDWPAYYLIVKKIDYVTGLPIRGASFKATSTSTSEVRYATTDENGIALFTCLSTGGLYWVEETSAAGGYEKDSTVQLIPSYQDIYAKHTPLIGGMNITREKATCRTTINKTQIPNYQDAYSGVYTNKRYLVNWYKKNAENNDMLKNIKFNVYTDIDSTDIEDESNSGVQKYIQKLKSDGFITADNTKTKNYYTSQASISDGAVTKVCYQPESPLVKAVDYVTSYESLNISDRELRSTSTSSMTSILNPPDNFSGNNFTTALMALDGIKVNSTNSHDNYEISITSENTEEDYGAIARKIEDNGGEISLANQIKNNYVANYRPTLIKYEISNGSISRTTVDNNVITLTTKEDGTQTLSKNELNNIPINIKITKTGTSKVLVSNLEIENDNWPTIPSGQYMQRSDLETLDNNLQTYEADISNRNSNYSSQYHTYPPQAYQAGSIRYIKKSTYDSKLASKREELDDPDHELTDSELDDICKSSDQIKDFINQYSEKLENYKLLKVINTKLSNRNDNYEDGIMQRHDYSRIDGIGNMYRDIYIIYEIEEEKLPSYSIKGISFEPNLDDYVAPRNTNFIADDNGEVCLSGVYKNKLYYIKETDDNTANALQAMRYDTLTLEPSLHFKPKTDTTMLDNGDAILEQLMAIKERNIQNRGTGNIEFMSSPTFVYFDGYGENVNVNTIENNVTYLEFTKQVNNSTPTGDDLTAVKKLKFKVYDTKGKVASADTPISFVLKDGEYWYENSSGNINELVVNDSSKFVIRNLPKNDSNETNRYKIVEVEDDGNKDDSNNSCSNMGFYYGGDVSFDLNHMYIPGDESSKEKVSMNNTPTMLTFTKTDIYKVLDYDDEVIAVERDNYFEGTDSSTSNSNTKVFDTIPFKLKDSNGNVMRLREISAGNYRYMPNSSTNTIEELHTNNGQLKIYNLCRSNSYYIVETGNATPEYFKVPTNLDLSSAGITSTINNGYPAVKYTIGKTKGASGETITQIMKNSPTEVVIRKLNEETLKVVADKKRTAKFELYQCAPGTEKCDSSNGERIYFENVENTSNEYKNGIYNYSKLNTQTNRELRLANGYMELMYLPASETNGGEKYVYSLVEVEPPSGYYRPIEPFMFSVNSVDANVKKDVNNTPTTIYFEKYDIYNVLDYDDQIVDLEKEHYYEQSDNATNSENPSKIFDTIPFVLKDDDGNTIKLHKVTDGEYTRIADEEETENEKNDQTNLYTKNGKFKITNLPRLNNYYIVEVGNSTPEYFSIPTNLDLSNVGIANTINNGYPAVKYSIPDTAPSSKSTVTQILKNTPTEISLRKLDKDTLKIVPDKKRVAEFELYQCTTSNCDASTGKRIYFEDVEDGSLEDTYGIYTYSKLNAQTNRKIKLTNGYMSFVYLPAAPSNGGEKYYYALVETQPPRGFYKPDEPVVFRIDSTNPAELATSDPALWAHQTKKDILNEATVIYFDKQDLYNYYIHTEDVPDKEEMVEDEYYFDTAIFKLNDDNEFKTKEYELIDVKKSTFGEAYFGKDFKQKLIDTYTNCKVEDKGVNFSNWDASKGGLYIYAPEWDEANNHDGTKLVKTKQLHTYKGRMIIRNLTFMGKYYITETTAPTDHNFILPTPNPVVEYDLQNNETNSTIMETIYNTPTRIEFIKKDIKYDYYIPDSTTTFNVYRCPKNVSECTPDDGELVYFNEYGEKEVEENGKKEYKLVSFNENDSTQKKVYRYSKYNNSENTIKDIHPYYGELILRYLSYDYKYVLVETVPPTRYVLESNTAFKKDAWKQFTINGETVDIKSIDVPNAPVSLKIKKYADDGELLTGAKFKLYEATTVSNNSGVYDYNGTTCDMNLNAMNQTKKLLKLKTIRDGLYEDRPEQDSSIIETCTDKVGAPCNNIKASLVNDKYVYSDLGTTIKNNNDIEIREGEALVTYLKYNTCYILEEIQAPTGYSLPKKKEDRFIMIRNISNDTIIDTFKDLVNVPTPFTFYKYDDHNQLLDGAEFKLQKLNDDKIYEDIPVTETSNTDGRRIYKVDKESENYTILTSNGSATVSYLAEGQYRIVETKAAPGFELPAKTVNVATFFVDAEGNTFGEAIIANKKKTKKVFIKPKASAEFIVNIQTGQVVMKYGIVLTTIIGLISLLFILRKRITKKEK